MVLSRVLLGLRVFSTVRSAILSQSVEIAVQRSCMTPCLVLPISRADTFPAKRGLTNEVPLRRSPVCQTVERP